MTIYNLAVDYRSLRCFPSGYHILDLCLHICERLLTFFHDELLEDNLSAQNEVDNLSAMLKRCLEMVREDLSGSICLDISYPIRIINIFANPYRLQRAEGTSFNLESPYVEPRILLDLVAMLIKETWTSLCPRLNMMRASKFRMLYHILKAIPPRLSDLVLGHMDIEAWRCALDFQLKIEICDGQQEEEFFSLCEPERHYKDDDTSS